MIGSRFDKYIIQEALGEGGMGSVYRAFHTGLNADVVLKMVSRKLLETNPKFGDLFAREAQLIAQLNHYAIVPVYDYGAYQGQPYIVMRLMAGGDLEAQIQQAPSPLSLHEASRIIQRTAEALDKAHSHQIVHRDIKPSNIMFDEEGLAYLGDFGIAKQTDATRADTTVGTWPYMAPEQWQGGEATAQTDIYQLGITLYQMLTGKLPYMADNAAGWLYQHTTGSIPSVTAHRPDLPTEMNRVIARALAKDPADRYDSAGAFSNDIQKVMRQEAVPRTVVFSETNLFPNQDNHMTQTEKASTRPWLWPLLGVVIGLGIVAAFGLGFLTSQRDGTTPVDDQTVTETIENVDETIVLQLGDRRTSDADGMVQLFIPAGSFSMGSTAEQADAAFELACEQDQGAICDRTIYTAEEPLHTVELDAYWVDQTEITNKMYDLCVADGDCTEPVTQFSEEKEIDVEAADYYSDPQFDDHPIIGIDWEQATAYCAWAGRQLPTEAQWERAARGDDDARTYPFGEVLSCAAVNFKGCFRRPAAVGSFSEGISPFGALDMSGNVWEWVEDWYDPDFYQTSPSKNPVGPAVPPAGSTASKVVRGSSWSGLDIAVRVNNRGRVPVDFTMDNLGVRCVELE